MTQQIIDGIYVVVVNPNHENGRFLSCLNVGVSVFEDVNIKGTPTYYAWKGTPVDHDFAPHSNIYYTLREAVDEVIGEPFTA